MKTESEIIELLATGAKFKMTKDINRYQYGGWYFGCKWNDAIVGEHPTSNNRVHKMMIKNDSTAAYILKNEKR